MEKKYRVICSDCYIDVFAISEDEAIEIAKDIDPIAEILSIIHLWTTD